MESARILLPVLLLALFAAAVPAGSDESYSSQPEEKIHEKVQELVAQDAGNETVKVIVKTKEGGNEESYKSSIENLGDVKRTYDQIDSFYVEIPKEDLDVLASQPFVESINPVYEIRATLQQSVPLINASTVTQQIVRGMNITGKSIGVCIIDTGVNYTHPDLGGCAPTSNINNASCDRVVAGYDFVNDDNDPMDDQGHGTHVAGIAGANGGIVGVAPDISIVAIKVLNSTGGGTTANLIAGIEWCVNNATKFNISVISMSLGGGSFSNYCDSDDPATAAAIDSAVARNISVVAASGNDGSTSGIDNPACIKNSTAVASTDDAGANKDKISSFSNRNSITDLLAPGSSINSTSRTGSYIKFSGTSMATPHVSGAFALLYQKFKLLYNSTPTPNFLENILNSSGVRITDNGGTGLTFTRIDVLGASNLIRPTRWSSTANFSTIERGSSANLSAFWESDIKLDKAILSTNETGSFVNYTNNSYSSPITFTSNSEWSNFTWSNTSLSNGTKVAWQIFANDTNNNENATSVLIFTILDTTGPTILNFTHTNESNYATNKNYSFNTTATDLSGIGNVVFEWNSSQNVTISSFETINSTSRLYKANRTGLGVGNYKYRWIASDTLNNSAVSSARTFNVTATTTSISLFLDGNQNNITFSRGDIVNITAIINITDANVSLLLFANFTGTSSEINSSIQPVSNLTNTSSLIFGAYYNVTAHYNGSNLNYSASSRTFFMIGGEAFRNLSLNITKNVLTTINASTTNVSLDILLNDTVNNNATNITVGTVNPFNVTPSGIGIGKFVRINASAALENRLNYTVLKYFYSTVEIPSNIDENSLRLLRWNGSNWQRFDGNLVGGVDTSAKFVFANLSSFSDFTISGLLANGQSCSTNSECSSGICSSNLCVAVPQPPAPSSGSSGGGGGGGSGAPASLSKQTTPNSKSPQQEKPKQNISSPKEEKPVQPSQPVVSTEKAPIPQTNLITGFFLFRSQPSVLTLIITALIVAAILLAYWKRMLIFKNRI